MTTICPGCHQPINDNSAVLLCGGIVFHQRCAPGIAGRRAPTNRAPLGPPWTPWKIVAGCLWVAGVLFCWPLAVLLLLIWVAAHCFADVARR